VLDLSNLTSAVVDGKYRIERMLGRSAREKARDRRRASPRAFSSSGPFG
jgi:hypothetical protein